VFTACVTVLAIAVAVINAVTGRALWRSQLFERSQKMAQIVLMWLVPGAFVIVRLALRESTLGQIGRAPSTDPTINREEGYYTDNPTAFNHGHGDGGHEL
jgi:hypothetical protein